MAAYNSPDSTSQVWRPLMKHLIGIAIGGLCCVGLVVGQEKDWVNLLDKDLKTHCFTTGNWVLDKDGVVALEPRPGEKGWQRYDAYLWAKKQYKDFECEFEYKFNKAG